MRGRLEFVDVSIGRRVQGARHVPSNPYNISFQEVIEIRTKEKELLEADPDQKELERQAHLREINSSSTCSIL